MELVTAERQVQFRDTVRHLAVRLQQESEGLLAEPDRVFGELMDRIGVDAAIYQPFQMKIRQDHGLPGNGPDRGAA